MAKVLLLHDCPSAMAVRASDLAPGNFTFERSDGVLPVGELDYTGAFGTDVVEVENDGIGLPTIDARRGFQICQEE